MQSVSHFLLFFYIILLTSGAGGVVALAMLHFRLRSPVSLSLLLVNSALLTSLFLTMLTFYMDSVIGTSAGPNPTLALHPLRTLAGYAIGIVVYGGTALALWHVPHTPRRILLVATGVAVFAMTAQSVLILFGYSDFAIQMRIPYVVVISLYLLVLGFLMVRYGGYASTDTMRWLLVRLGHLTVIFALLSAVAYLVVSRIKFLADLGINFDFLFYLAWSVLSIIAFARYLIRPSALAGNEEISAGFVSTYGITPREIEVIRLVGRGMSNREIADAMGISFTTVRTHVYNVFQKTGAGSRVDLLRLVAGYRE